MALAEKGKTHREIAKETGVSPNTIKAVLNKTGLDQTISTPGKSLDKYEKRLGVGTDTKELKPLQRSGL